MTRVELKEYELYEMYDDYLCDIHEVATICGYEYDAAYALKVVDRVAYEDGFKGWLDLMAEDGRFKCIDDKYYQEF